ncbi:MAG: glycine betaine ABC transporter substrate-binding protein [Clostridia bacterium]
MKPKVATSLIVIALVPTLLVSSQDVRIFGKEKLLHPDQMMISQKALVIIGAPPFTEQQLLKKMTAILLKEHGYRVEEIEFYDSRTIRNAQENGYIDLYWEYTNSARTVYHKKPPVFDPEQAFLAVAEEDHKKGLVWLPKSQFNNKWAIIMKEQIARLLHIKTISDLVAYTNQYPQKLKIATNKTFLYSQKGFEFLQQAYGIEPEKADIIALNNELLANAVQEGNVDVAVGWVTFGKLMDANSRLVLLEDDRHVFPPDYIAPVVNEQLLQRNPELEPLIRNVTNALNEETMRELNYKVDVLNIPIAKVARQFLLQAGLIPAQRADTSK